MSEEERAPSEPTMGDVFDGRYEILEVLGEGGVGVVYRARRLKLGLMVAIKLLRHQSAADAEIRLRFEREARALAALAHPHIVSMTDFGVWEGRPYLVMEWLDGQTLRDRLREGRPPVGELISIMVQLARGLAAAHSEGLVHRDLKPENVFLQRLSDQPPHVKILDFGFAKLADEQVPARMRDITRAGFVFGTPAYMSPEQAVGDPMDARTDVYAVGVMLFEGLTGRRPFEGDYPEQRRAKIAEEPPELQDCAPDLRVSDELAALVRKALASDRRERHADASELLEALLALPRPSARPVGAAHTLLRSSLTALSSLSPRASLPSLASLAFRGRVRLALVMGAAAVLALLAGWWLLRGADVPAAASVKASASAAAASAPPASGPAAAPAASAASTAAVSALPTSASDLALPASGPVEAPAASPSDDAPAPEPAALAAGPESESGSQSAEHDPALARHEAIEEMVFALEDVPTPPQGPAAVERPAARNPWKRAGLPAAVRAAQRRASRGQTLNARALEAVRSFAREHRDDPRGSLILAYVYADRMWLTDAIERYRLAARIDPSARGDRRMQDDLIHFVLVAKLRARARAAVLEIYGREALPRIERILRRDRLTQAERDALSALRADVLAASTEARPAAP